MRNLHKFISDPIWDGSSVPSKGLEKLQIRDSDYRNHQILTLKCISKGTTPVSIKLKTTVRTEKAKKIIRNAERDLYRLGLNPLIVS